MPQVPSTQEMVRDPDYWIYIKQLYLAVDDLARGKMELDYGWWILQEQVMRKGSNPFQMAEDGLRSISFTKTTFWVGEAGEALFEHLR